MSNKKFRYKFDDVFAYIEMLSETSLNKIWKNKKEDIWSQYLSKDMNHPIKRLKRR